VYPATSDTQSYPVEITYPKYSVQWPCRPVSWTGHRSSEKPSSRSIRPSATFRINTLCHNTNKYTRLFL